jgi:hypothetical protein
MAFIVPQLAPRHGMQSRLDFLEAPLRYLDAAALNPFRVDAVSLSYAIDGDASAKLVRFDFPQDRRNFHPQATPNMGRTRRAAGSYGRILLIVAGSDPSREDTLARRQRFIGGTSRHRQGPRSGARLGEAA